jgi:tetratricopeptide (TPR) repeat protein
MCLSDRGEPEKALPYFERALEINVMANVLWGIVRIKANIAFWVYCRQGKGELAYQVGQEAIRIANESGDINSKGLANYALGCSYYLMGRFDKAEEHLVKSFDFCIKSDQLGFAAGASIFLGIISSNRREYETSQKYFERSTSLYHHCSTCPSWIIFNKISMALGKVMNKEKNMNLNEIFKWYEDIKNKWPKGWAVNLIGKILLNIDGQRISEAEDWIKRSIETNQKYGMMWQLAQDYALYAEFYLRKGNLSKAKENMNKAIEIFKECSADGWVERYQKELASLS